MTFEEAKNIFLNRGYVEVPGGTYYDADKWREAITVISKWLEQEPCEDCISRQAVLSYICNDLEFGDEENGCDLERKIAQEEIYNFIKKMKPITSKQEPCEDTISRQEAILQVQRYGVGCFDAEEFSSEQCERFVIQKLNELPPVTPKERTGRWIDQSGGDPTDFSVSCNLCNEWVSQSTNFCPNCGARMVSE